MERKSLNRVFWVALLGVAFVGFITLMSRTGRDGSVGVRTQDVGVQVQSLSPDEIRNAPTFSGRGLDTDVLDSSGMTRVQIADDKGQLQYEFIYQAMTPKQQGQFEVQNPQARIYLSPSQVIHLRGERGSFIAPGNQPQSGEFKGNLTITFFRSPASRRVNLAPDSPDRQAELYLPEGATFDTTLGEIRSSGPVKVVTPITQQMEFSGRGLRLIYNVPAERVDYLEVFEGEALRFRPLARGGDDEAEPPAGVSPPTTTPPDATPTQAQYYKVNFGQNVRVTNKGNTVHAEQLVAYLSVLDAPSEPLASPSSNTPEPASQPAEENKPLVFDDSKSITITWQGKMVMVPTAEPPPQIVGREEVFVRFSGKPVTIQMEDGGKVVATEIDYLRSLNQVTAVGSEVFPLRLNSPSMGEVSVPKIALNLGEDRGQLIGPGSMEAPKQDPANPQAQESKGLPPGFKIVWSNGVNLTFAADARGSTTIESATFVGGVRAGESRFQLEAEQVGVHFKPGTEQPRLHRFDAVGDVRIQSEGASVQAGKLRLDLDTSSEDDLLPSRLLAEGAVRVERAEEKIAAEYLDVSFRPLSDVEKLAAKAGKSAKPEGERDPSVLGEERLANVRVTRVVARSNVKLTQGQTEILADTLEADNDAGTADLRGAPLQIARLGDAPGKPLTELHVPVVRIERRGELAHAQGPGKLVYTDKQDKPNTPPRRVVVTWKERMAYDGQAGLIQAFGDVKADSEESQTEMNSISAGQISLELIDPEVAEKIAGAAKAPRENGDTGFEGMMGNRVLRKMTARDNVRVEAKRWHDPERKNLELMLTIMDCPILLYTQADERAKIPGPGRAVIQNYAKPGSPESAGKKGVQLSGQGHSIFTWTKSLTFDQLNRDLLAEGEVWMTHQPHGGGQIIEVQSDHLIADMPAMDTAKPTQFSGVTSLNIEKIKCTGNVKVRRGDLTGEADILFYDGATKTAVFAAGKGRRVEFRDPRQPGKPLVGTGVLWNLETEELEIRDPMGTLSF